MDTASASYLDDFLRDNLSLDTLNDKARELGVVRRQRKTDIAALLSVILLTLPVRDHIRRAQMFRSYHGRFTQLDGCRSRHGPSSHGPTLDGGQMLNTL